MTRCHRSARHREVISAAALLFALAATPLHAALPSSPDSYLDQAARVRRASDRPWAPETGRLGNLRHLQITAKDCTVRIVSGAENRVFPGTRDLVVVEQSRVLDADPNERPTPRDVVLAPDHAQACPGPGSCGVSVTPLKRTAETGDTVCFTVQIATAHDLLIGGDGLGLLVDRVKQPALRIAINPSHHLRVWLERVELGLLSLDANAPVLVGGNGTVDLLRAGSSNSASRMLLHGFDANTVGVSATTTGTQWSIRIGETTKAGYYQPARAPGELAELYTIEVEGPIERLQTPAGRVSPRPLADASRRMLRALRDELHGLAGPAPVLPAADPALSTATAAAAALPRDGRERVAQVVARFLPASVKITAVTLWKQGGRLEGIAPDAATARDVARRLDASGEFTAVSGGGGTPRDGGYAFSTQMFFSCDAPGEPSECPAAEPAGATRYSEAQVRDTLVRLLGPTVAMRSLVVDGDTLRMKADAPNEAEARAALGRVDKGTRLFRPSVSGIGPPRGGPTIDVDAVFKLVCKVPPSADGICAPH